MRCAYFFSLFIRLPINSFTHYVNLHIKNVCTSYLLMIRCKHFIKIDHKAKKYSPINVIYTKRLKWDHSSNFITEFNGQNSVEKKLQWNFFYIWIFVEILLIKKRSKIEKASVFRTFRKLANEYWSLRKKCFECHELVFALRSK